MIMVTPWTHVMILGIWLHWQAKLILYMSLLLLLALLSIWLCRQREEYCWPVVSFNNSMMMIFPKHPARSKGGVEIRAEPLEKLFSEGLR